MRLIRALLVLGLIITFFFSYSCQNKIQIPEFSEFLTEKPLLSPDQLTKEEIQKLFKVKEIPYFITTTGRLFRVNPSDYTIQLIQVFPNLKNFTVQGDILLMTTKKERRSFYSPITKTRIKFVVKDFARCLTFNTTHCLYLNPDNQLILYNYKTQKTIHRINLKKDQKIHDILLYHNEFLVCLTKTIYRYNISTNYLATFSMINPIDSPILFFDQDIYYCSSNRDLVRFSLLGKKTIWKRPLPHFLDFRPLLVKGFIALILRDNNIHFYSQTGNILWTRDLDQSILYPPLPLKDSIATILYPKQTPVINIFYPEKKIKMTHQTNQRLIDPLYVENQLLFIVQDQSRHKNDLVSISNNYLMDIKISPDRIKIINQSVIFTFNPINLIEPYCNIKIFHKSSELLLDSNLAYYESPTLAFIPPKPGKYVIVLKIKAQNKKEFEIRKTFYIFDVFSLLNNYFFQIQSNSITDQKTIKDESEPKKENK